MEHQNNLPQKNKQDDSSEDPRHEGHAKEWQDRARFVLDAKEKVDDVGSAKQSPTGEEIKDEEKKEDIASY